MPAIPGCKLRQLVPGCGKKAWDFWSFLSFLVRKKCWTWELDFMGEKERDAPWLVQIPSPVQGL